LRVGNGLDDKRYRRDPAVVAAYQADPLCHDRISARLARFIADAGPATLARAAHWACHPAAVGRRRPPVRPAGSAAFAAAAAAWCQSQCVDGLS
jgi:hypothetical protein